MAATAVAFLTWIYRANLNCRGFGAQNMRYTPGWAVGYYFIPFLNLFRPYQVMREIWQVSQNPADWEAQPVSPVLGWWWTAWLTSGVLGHILFRIAMSADSVEDLRLATQVSISASCVGLVLCVCAAFLVNSIGRRQEHLVSRPTV